MLAKSLVGEGARRSEQGMDNQCNLRILIGKATAEYFLFADARGLYAKVGALFGGIG
jgi:hypothetical protein